MAEVASVPVTNPSHSRGVDEKEGSIRLPKAQVVEKPARELSRDRQEKLLKRASTQLSDALKSDLKPETKKAYLMTAQNNLRTLLKSVTDPEIEKGSLYYLGFCERALGNNASACEAFESYLEKSSASERTDEFRVLGELGNSYFDRATQGEASDASLLQSATNAYSKALELSVDTEQANTKGQENTRFFRGESRRLLAEISGGEQSALLEQQALEDFKAVITSGGSLASAAAERLNTLYTSRGELEKALGSVSRSANPERWASTRYQQALKHYEDGRFDDAFVAAEESLSVEEFREPESRLKLHIVRGDSALRIGQTAVATGAESSVDLNKELATLGRAVSEITIGKDNPDVARDIATALAVKSSISFSLLEGESDVERREELLKGVSKDVQALEGLDSQVAAPYLRDVHSDLVSFHYESENSSGVVAAVEALKGLGGIRDAVQRYQYADSLSKLGSDTEAETVFKGLLNSADLDSQSTSFQALDTASENNGLAVRAGLKLIDIYTEGEKFAQASDVVEELKKNFPQALNHADIQYDIVFSVSRSETLPQAEKNKIFEGYVKSYPDTDVTKDLRRVLSSGYQQGGQHLKALGHLEALRASDSLNELDQARFATAKLGLGRELTAQGEYDVAAKVLEELDQGRNSVKMAIIENAIGKAGGLREDSKYDEALDVLRGARELLPNSEPGVEAYIESAVTLMARNANASDLINAETMLLDAAEEAGGYSEELSSLVTAENPPSAEIAKSLSARVETFNGLRKEAIEKRAEALKLLGRK